MPTMVENSGSMRLPKSNPIKSMSRFPKYYLSLVFIVAACCDSRAAMFYAQTPEGADVSAKVTRGRDAAADRLGKLVETQSRISKLLPQITPAIVAIEGGSGVIISPNGIVLTVSHVSQKAGRIVEVRLSDGRVVTGKTLGTNHNTDTAAIQLNGSGPWPHITICKSKIINQGDWCLALGYPLSFPRGSAAAVRLGRIQEIEEDRLITDCPIMGGDSGGALINLDGELIGVSSRIKTDIAQNIHIPLRTFRREWKQLAASEDIQETTSPDRKQAYLGIQGETDGNRVRIRHVHQGSPAAAAGLQTEDVVVRLNQKPINKFDDILEILKQHRPGEQIVAQLNRFGSLIEVEIMLGQRN